jgi:hypothetical protein
MWFIRGNVVRDLLALNKIELLPWDGWGLVSQDERDLTADDMALLDRVAALTLVDDPPYAEVRAICEDERLRMPPDYAANPQRFSLLGSGE